MKKSVMLAAMLCLAVSAVKAAPTQPTYSVPDQFGNPSPYQTLDNYGYNTYYVESSTPSNTPVTLGVGSGLLYGVSCSSGALGDYGIAFDSATGTGLTAATQSRAISPWVLSSANAVTTSSTTPGNAAGAVYGQWSAPHGAARFTNGLSFIKSGTYSFCLVQALFDANVNSSSH